MIHDLFGKLKYKDGDESWAGSARLPAFAAVGMLPDPPELSAEEAAAEAERLAAELKEAMENMRRMMVERFGDRATAALEAADHAAEEEVELPEPMDESRERRRAERRARHAALLAKGKFPIRVVGPDQAPPTPAQEAAYRFLVEHERPVFDAVVGQVWESYRASPWARPAGSAPVATPAGLTGQFAITRLEIAREARGGLAHLVFMIAARWEDEHGLMVVYSPDVREAAWTTWDGLYDLLESDEPPEPGTEYVPSPHDHLLEAILTGDEAQARELVAAGADINALGPDEYPPLWIAVDQIEPDEVRRLLAFGADPALANPDERTTPLKHARKLYRDMGFGPAKKRDELMEGVISMMRDVVGSQMAELKARLDAIIGLLEAATK